MSLVKFPLLLLPPGEAACFKFINVHSIYSYKGETIPFGIYLYPINDFNQENSLKQSYMLDRRVIA